MKTQILNYLSIAINPLTVQSVAKMTSYFNKIKMT